MRESRNPDTYNLLMQDLPVSSIEDVERALKAHKYVADRSLATTIFLALTLAKPLLLEGEAGVGKTEVGKVLADILGTRLIRLQCYEGIDVNNAVYEWAYATPPSPRSTAHSSWSSARCCRRSRAKGRPRRCC